MKRSVIAAVVLALAGPFSYQQAQARIAPVPHSGPKCTVSGECASGLPTYLAAVHIGITRSGKLVNLGTTHGLSPNVLKPPPTPPPATAPPEATDTPVTTPAVTATPAPTIALGDDTGPSNGPDGPNDDGSYAVDANDDPLASVPTGDGSGDSTTTVLGSGTSMVMDSGGFYNPTPWTSGYGKDCGDPTNSWPDSTTSCSDIQLELTFYFYYNYVRAWQKDGPYCSKFTGSVHYATLTWKGYSNPDPYHVTGGCNWTVGRTFMGVQWTKGYVMQRVYANPNGTWSYKGYRSP